MDRARARAVGDAATRSASCLGVSDIMRNGRVGTRAGAGVVATTGGADAVECGGEAGSW